jgi:phage-related minor tail protein
MVKVSKNIALIGLCVCLCAIIIGILLLLISGGGILAFIGTVVVAISAFLAAVIYLISTRSANVIESSNRIMTLACVNLGIIGIFVSIVSGGGSLVGTIAVAISAFLAALLYIIANYSVNRRII